MHDVVVAVLVAGRRVLLVHRSPTRSAYPDVWDLPGGHVEAGESTTRAIVRELWEELRVTVRAAHVHTLAPPLVAMGDLRVTFCRVRLWRGEPVNACPAEHDRIGWFTAGHLADLDLAHPGLADLLAGVLEAPG